MKSIFLFAIVLMFYLYSCIGAGTHGSIKCYKYDVPKNVLETALRSVIAESNTIKQDTAKDFYNNDTTYVTLTISYENIANTYTLRYGGGAEYWDSSKVSSISISYAHNKKGEGGSSGNGGVKWYNFSLKKELTEPFEQELVSKIDKELGITHTVE